MTAVPLAFLLVISMLPGLPGWISSPAPLYHPGVSNSGADSLTFESAQLLQLYDSYRLGYPGSKSRTPARFIDSIRVDFFEPAVLNDLPRIKMHRTEENHILHIGFDFFDNQEEESLFPIGHFLERYLLHVLTLQPSNRSAYVLADRIRILANDVQYGNLGSLDLNTLIKALYHRRILHVDHHDGGHIVRFEDKDKNQFIIEIPSRLELISGKDKKELDDAFARVLQRLTQAPPSTRLPETTAIQDLTPYQTPLFAGKESALIPGMLSRSYFLRDSGVFKRAYDKEFPLESLANELQYPLHMPDVSLLLVHKTYDRQYNAYEIDLATLIYTLSPTSEIFVGFETDNNGLVKSTQFFKDKTYNSIHVLSIDWPPELLWASDHSSLSAVLYSHIRLDNVKELFGQYIKEYDKEKINIQINNK